MIEGASASRSVVGHGEQGNKEEGLPWSIENQMTSIDGLNTTQARYRQRVRAPCPRSQSFQRRCLLLCSRARSLSRSRSIDDQGCEC
jgi:hypothetical protein